VEIRNRIAKLVEGEPEPEYAFLHLLHATKEAVDATGVEWAEAAEYMLNKFADSVEEVPPEVSILRPTD
jgi:predicted negative regulator of RcsB-dependent stress response